MKKRTFHLATALLLGLTLAGPSRADTMTSNGKPPSLAIPIPSPSRHSAWHTAVFGPTDDVAALLTCLPEAAAATAKVTPIVFTDPASNQVVTYQSVIYLDLPTLEWTADMCYALGPECYIRCPFDSLQ